MKNIAMMGMGYVGLTLAVALSKHFRVYGIDPNEEVCESLKKGEAHFREIGLNNLLNHHVSSGNLRIHNALPDDTNIDVYVVCVGTPLQKETKVANTEYIHNVIKDVGQHLKKDSLVILRSTVSLGTCREVAIPILEKESNLKAGNDFQFVFAPERTIEGKAIIELESNPQIIGGYSDKCVSSAFKLFNKLTPTVIQVSSLESAEMVKLMDNSYRDMHFAYANEIAVICERMNLDALELISAANNHYPRNNIPKPSPGVGGACLSKDPYILANSVEKKGYHSSLILQGRSRNEEIISQIVDRLDRNIKKHGKNLSDCKVGIAGFAFKGNPENSDLRDSTSLWFLDKLKEHVDISNINGYDPVIPASDLKHLGIKCFDSIELASEDVDIFMFMNNHLSYQEINPKDLAENMNTPGILYDAWAMLDKDLFESVSEVEYMGVGF